MQSTYRSATDEEVRTAVANGDKREIFAVMCRENGDLIERELTASEAVHDIEVFEKEDRENDSYTEDFYEVGIKDTNN